MKELQIIRGSPYFVNEILKLGKPGLFQNQTNDPSATAEDTRERELKQLRFIPSKDNNRDAFLSDLREKNNLFTDFDQGELNGEFYNRILRSQLIQDSTVKSLNKRSGGVENLSNSVVFNYYDDKKNLCGVCIHYSQKDSALWTATIIRNVNEKRENRIVQIIMPQTLFANLTAKDKGKEKVKEEVMEERICKPIEENIASKTFNDFLNSKQIEQQFVGCFEEGPNVNINNLNKLHNELEEKHASQSVPPIEDSSAAQEQNKPSFFRRNRLAIIIGGVGTVGLAAASIVVLGGMAALMLTSLFTPIGPFVAAAVAGLLVTSAIITGIVALGKVIHNENKRDAKSNIPAAGTGSIPEGENWSDAKFQQKNTSLYGKGISFLSNHFHGTQNKKTNNNKDSEQTPSTSDNTRAAPGT